MCLCICAREKTRFGTVRLFGRLKLELEGTFGPRMRKLHASKSNDRGRMSIQIFYENFHTHHVLTSLSCTHAWPTTPLEGLLLLLPLCPLLYHHVLERFDALTIDHH